MTTDWGRRSGRPTRFADRRAAGQALAEQLREYARRTDVNVLGLPRGGVPVAAEIARELGAPLDVFLVRKLGVPGHSELAMGAIASGGIEVLSEPLIRDLEIPPAVVQQVAVRERLELDRRDVAYRAGRAMPSLRDLTVILVDDGLATGSSMQAAVLAVRQQRPARIIVAVPVGAPDTCDRLGRLADRVVCLLMPEPFEAVGLWYDDFSQTTDEEVLAALRSSAAAREGMRRSRPGASAVEVVRARALPLKGDPAQYDALLEGIGDARLVLLGEATHGTHEFYRERAFITRRLIEEKGFVGVAVEADWPDAYRINRYVRLEGGLRGGSEASDEDAVQALGDFGQFPSWMWRNADVLDFVGWLRTHNERRASDERTGFYGLDLYSLRASTQAVLAYLDTVDPAAAARARQRFGCFDQYSGDMQEYGYAASLGLTRSCESDAVAQLAELHQRRVEYASRDGRVAADDFFFADQNARLVRSAEEYYRTMFGGHVESWNLRDRHMVETLTRILRFLDRQQPGARLVVWAHNSHLGDARATEMRDRGEWNVGQLVREEYHADAVLVGFTTFDGTVTAASDWDGPAQRKRVRPALPGSYERLFHEAAIPRMLLPLRGDAELAAVLATPRLERAIGVLYLPESERRSHYFHAALSEQFDYVLHIDQTRAVEPLERDPLWEAGESAETYPTGL